MFKRLIARAKFDEAWYLRAYPDVRDAVRAGTFKNGFAHYWNFGREEGRLPSEPHFDEQWYLAVYDDVREHLSRGEFKSGFDHYVKIGSREGRLPGPRHFHVSIRPD